MKNEYKVTKELMMSWAKEIHLIGTANVALFVFWCLWGAIGLTYLIFLFIYGVSWLTWYCSVIIVFLSVFRLFIARFIVISKRYKMLSQIYGVSEWIRTIEFSDDEIICLDHNSITKLGYSNIKKIKEKNNDILIFFNNNLGLRLYKDAFVEGTWEDCKKKINSIIK